MKTEDKPEQMVHKAGRQASRVTEAQHEPPAKSSFKTAMCLTAEKAQHRILKVANAPNAALITGGKFQVNQKQALKTHIRQHEAPH